MNDADVTRALSAINPLALTGGYVGTAWHGTAVTDGMTVHAIVVPDAPAAGRGRRKPKPSGKRKPGGKGKPGRPRKAAADTVTLPVGTGKGKGKPGRPRKAAGKVPPPPRAGGKRKADAPAPDPAPAPPAPSGAPVVPFAPA